MSSVSCDASVASTSAGSVSAPSFVSSLPPTTYLRGGIQQMLNASPDPSFMYQYASPSFSSSSSLYSTTNRGRVTQPAPSYLDYTAATNVPYYYPPYLPVAQASAQYASPSETANPCTVAPNASVYHRTVISSPASQQQQQQQHYLQPPLAHPAATTMSSSRSTPASSSTAVAVNNTGVGIQKRRFSTPPVGGSTEQQSNNHHNVTDSVPLGVPASSIYGTAGSMGPQQTRWVGVGEDVGSRNFYNALQQQLMASACYPQEVQFYPSHRVVTEPYWTAYPNNSTASQIALYSREHQFTPPPPPQLGPPTVREEQPAALQQDCYYSDLTATLQNLGFYGGGGSGGSGVPSERGTYSPSHFATDAVPWGYHSSPSQTSSSFPAIYGALTPTHGHHSMGAGTKFYQNDFNPEEVAQICPWINPPDLDPSLIWRTRYFVIKSNSTRHVMLSIQHGVWCSTSAGNDCLNRAYLSMQQRPSAAQFDEQSSSAVDEASGSPTGPLVTSSSGAGAAEVADEKKGGWSAPGRVLLFFSVNTSGCFCGVAEMTSPVDKMKQLDIWQDSRWRGAFKVRWIYAKCVSNKLLRHIQVESAENRAVTHLRDTNEILPASKGEEMLQIIHDT